MTSFTQAALNLSNYIENEEAILEEVLNHLSFNTSLRNGLPVLLNYLCKPDNFTYLLNLIEGISLPQGKFPGKTISNCLRFFTTQSRPVVALLENNSILINWINTFHRSKNSIDEIVCGRFQQIVENVCRATNGLFLDN